VGEETLRKSFRSVVEGPDRSTDLVPRDDFRVLEPLGVAQVL